MKKENRRGWTELEPRETKTNRVEGEFQLVAAATGEIKFRDFSSLCGCHDREYKQVSPSEFSRWARGTHRKSTTIQTCLYLSRGETSGGCARTTGERATVAEKWGRSWRGLKEGKYPRDAASRSGSIPRENAFGTDMRASIG